MGIPTITTGLEAAEAILYSRPEEARDRISVAMRDLEGVELGRAKVLIALTYKGTGELSEGLAIVDTLLSEETTDEIKFRALLAKAALQANKPKASLRTLALAEPYFETVDLRLRGMWHNQRARGLKETKQYDQAVIEYAGAAAFFDLAGNPSCAAIAINNEAGVFLKWGRHDDALEAVDRAVAAFAALDDPYLMNTMDQKAQILVAQGLPDAAKLLSDQVIAAVEIGDRKELLLESLLTRASALIRLRMIVEAFRDIDRAQQVANYLSRADLRLTVAKARKDVAAVCLSLAHVDMVELALEQSGGAVRVAAQKLGLNHASLIEFARTHDLDRRQVRRKSVISSRQK